MKTITTQFVLLAIIVCVQARSAELPSAEHGSDAQEAANADVPSNTLSDEEKQLGWKLLFDGKKIEGWRSYQTNTFPERGWVVENGTLHKQAGEKPGDIMTVDTYENFELTWEWKLLGKGNNGVKYFITEKRGAGGTRIPDDRRHEGAKRIHDQCLLLFRRETCCREADRAVDCPWQGVG